MSVSSFQILGFATAELFASSRHPNELKLKGTLVMLDEPSSKAPHGSNGHKIFVTSAVARKRLDTLLNMGLNYAPSLQEHAARRKVGVITKAWIDGKKLKVEATIWKKDFPEAERDLKRVGLGMSMEISQVQVEDQDASVWVLSDFVFTGATVLEKTSAAYYKTDAIAAAAAKSKEHKMAVKTKKKVIAARRSDEELVQLAVEASVEAVAKILKPFQRTQGQLLTRLDAMEAEADEVEAEADEDEEEEAEVEVRAAKKKKPAMDDEDDDEEEDDDEDDIDSEIDTGDEEELGPEEEAGDDKPGKMNRGAMNKGRKSASENKVGKSVASARLAASLVREKKANRTVAAMTEELRKMKRQLKEVKTQVTAAAEEQGRKRTMLPAELAGVLRKGGIDPVELQASGEKLSVEQVDAVLQAVDGLPIAKRMEIKHGFAKAGVMDEGFVRR